MFTSRSFLMVAILFSVAVQLSAAVPSAEPLLLAGTPVIPADWRNDLPVKKTADWYASGANGGIELSPDGVRLIALKQPEAVYLLQAAVLNQVAVTPSETMLIRFAARSLKADRDTGSTKLTVSFETSRPPWTRASLKIELGVGAEWERFDIPFTCLDEFAATAAKLSFTFGYPAQVVEISDVQLLRFGPEVAVSSLPRTKRHADGFPPELMAQEFTRIAALRRELAAVSDPAPAHGRVLHVEEVAAGGDGSVEHPFNAIPAALAVVTPGDTIVVGAGEYHDPWGVVIKTSGRPDAWIHLQAAPGARPKLISSGWGGIELPFGVGYVEVKGFELAWVADPDVAGDHGTSIHGSGIAPMYASHHIRIIDNVIHGFGTGGVCALDCDYLLVEGNRIYDCAKTSPYGGSAISLCRAFNFDEAPGYHSVVRRNICYDNELLVSTSVDSGGNGHALTDGNGIIIDNFTRSRKNPLKKHSLDKDGPLEPYRHRTLVENHLLYNKGGRGVHVFRSNLVDVINNTCYMNQKSADINAGELTVIEARGAVIADNVAWSRPGKRGNSQDGSTQVLWYSNLFYGGDDVLLHEGVIVGQDPLLIAPGLTAKPEGFMLRTGSPAVGTGMGSIAPVDDLTGAQRLPVGRIDLGAYQLAPQPQ